MRHAKEEQLSTVSRAIDLISAVKELHGLSYHELSRLSRNTENFTVQYLTEKGSTVKIDIEKLAGFLPLHLTAVLMSSDRDESRFRYLLCGIRLLHSLSDLASRHAKLEQNLLDDVKLLEQLLDLVFYMLIVVGGYRQEDRSFGPTPLLYSALVPCSLHLLTGFISSQWQDLVHVLLAHPKVDIFMDAAFGSIRQVIRCLNMTLSAYCNDFPMESNLAAEPVVNYLCQQCEASLQFLHLLCQQKMFQERLLKNKELCGKGGVLFLAQSVLKLNIPPPFVESPRVMAAASRMKAKILSILLNLCEADTISYLDEVASSSRSLDLAKSVALEVLELLKTAFGRYPTRLAASSRGYPAGLLQLNAMRLADIFSDDSNFRSFITTYFAKVLTAIFSLSHGDFLSCWCSSNLPDREEDATLEYDVFAAAGWVLDSSSSMDLLKAKKLELPLISNDMAQSSYAHQRTSLFVKVIANLHCFVPTICQEQERNLFLLKVLECLQIDLSELLPEFSFPSSVPKAATVCKNLRSLISHAESLIPNFLNEEDVSLLRVFFNQLQSRISAADYGENPAHKTQGSKHEESLSWDKFSKLNINDHHQEAHSGGGCSSPLQSKEPASLSKSGNMKEGTSENSAFQGLDQFYASYLQKHYLGENKGISSKVTSGSARGINEDAQNVETSGSDTSSAKEKNVSEHVDNADISKSSENIKKGVSGETPEDEKVETIQRRKRKRTIMNDQQINLIEMALKHEPDMQRNAASIQSWADKLSSDGSEVTASQLKNWLNNRKARLARTAAKDVRAIDIVNPVRDKQRVPVIDPPESPAEVAFVSSDARKDPQSISRIASGENPESMLAEFADDGSPFIQRKPGQHVVLVDVQGEEIGKGRVYQVHGKWSGRNLEESETCVVDINELKVERWVRLPYPSEATGNSFEEAKTKLGIMRVLWDSNRIFMLP
ncbi:nodulin homeobox isoform X1 [Quillaja saponaria]|uniref:Nodulin homeobox isoform X1 n=1 Tax=Quillaja saponaria TaxID=32244 RepID=A0AAD7QG91_QUISA|nr:nodulin homeobox isoform X1 [Quillaja saponaria]